MFLNIMFEPKEFLTNYNITSFNSAINWINAHESPLPTYMRIIDYAWFAYDFDDISIDYTLVKLYMKVIDKCWINEIFDKVKEFIYIDIDKDVIYLKRNLGKVQENDEIKLKYLKEKFITQQIIYDMLLVYISSKNMNVVGSHNHNIKLFFVEYITKMVNEII